MSSHTVTLSLDCDGLPHEDLPKAVVASKHLQLVKNSPFCAGIASKDPSCHPHPPSPPWRAVSQMKRDHL